MMAGLNPQFGGLLRLVAGPASVPLGHGKPNVDVQAGDVVFNSFRNAHLNVRLCVSFRDLFAH